MYCRTVLLAMSDFYTTKDVFRKRCEDITWLETTNWVTIQSPITYFMHVRGDDSHANEVLNLFKTMPMTSYTDYFEADGTYMKSYLWNVYGNLAGCAAVTTAVLEMILTKFCWMGNAAIEAALLSFHSYPEMGKFPTDMVFRYLVAPVQIECSLSWTVIIMDLARRTVFKYDPMCNPVSQTITTSYWRTVVIPELEDWGARNGKRWNFQDMREEWIKGPKLLQRDMEHSGVYVLLMCLDYLNGSDVFRTQKHINGKHIEVARLRFLWMLLCMGEPTYQGPDNDKVMEAEATGEALRKLLVEHNTL